MTADNLFAGHSRSHRTQLTAKEAARIIARYANQHRLSSAQTARLILKWRSHYQQAISKKEPLG